MVLAQMVIDAVVVEVRGFEPLTPCMPSALFHFADVR
jgi:hypothetical protein